MTSSANIERSNNRPQIFLKLACSLDGYLDDSLSKRHVFSAENDTLEVDKIRAESDAIFVGAETLRKDNPRLKLKIVKGKDPIRVSISSKCELSQDLNFFQNDGVKKILYTKSVSNPDLREIKDLEIVERIDLSLDFVVSDLFQKGVKKLLVEGGAALAAEFLEKNLVDKIRIAYAPEILGKNGRGSMAEKITSLPENKFVIKRVKKVDGLSVVEIASRVLSHRSQ